MNELTKKPAVVAVIGSTKFKEHHLGWAQKLTLQGKVPWLVGLFHHRDMVPITDAQKAAVDAATILRVERADEVLVVNVNGYVGESTRRAVVHARRIGRPVSYTDGAPAWDSGEVGPRPADE